MNARKLMVGDWVRIKDLKDPIRRLSGIDEYRGKVEFWYGEKLIVTSIDNVLPIPLTPEMVERLSDIKELVMFWDDRKTEETGENWYETCINCDNGNTLTIDIRYVHELQHALRLAGIGKEIEL